MRPQTGTVQALYYAQKTNPLFNMPVLQITSLSRFSFGANEKNRYKANLSDGTHYIKCVFSSELSNKFDSEEICKFTVIKLGSFTIRPKENSVYLYVQNIDEYELFENVIGHPVNIFSGKQSLDPSLNKQEDEKRTPITVSSPNNNTVDSEQKTRNTLSYTKKETAPNEPLKKLKVEGDSGRITEIKKIFPHKKNLTFRGRIVSKSEIKKFNTQKGEGKLFSFEVADKTGQIKCVAFSESVDAFFPIIESGRVYEISNVTVKPANKKFSNATSDFEIQLEKNSEVVASNDDDIPQYMFKFVKISDLGTVGGIVDCLAVIKEVYPVATIIIKSTGKETSKRDLVVIDQTGNCRLTLWGIKAEAEYEKDTVICIKSVKVGDYNGVNLSTLASSVIMPNIDITESVELLSWYQDEGRDIVIEKVRAVPKRSFINEIKENSLEYANIRASAMFMKTEGLYYDACPSENCNKKVSAEENGLYRCEKCNYTFDKCNQRYMINLHVGDFTGQLWVTLFDDHGKALLGSSATELKEMCDNNPEDVHNLVKSVMSKEYQFKIRSKEENYNGEPKLRSNCLEFFSVDYVAETKRMLEAIERATA
ncbi:uncharacterized protein LOC143922084 [Arctopsyche grandis]|uniref:uncharacterized protein LOC143922084 n=1 Tax=Arctopsyche grandis TaxID=121162 RepID=UPI00406D88A9